MYIDMIKITENGKILDKKPKVCFSKKYYRVKNCTRVNNLCELPEIVSEKSFMYKGYWPGLPDFSCCMIPKPEKCTK
jgi:hypothetical protein